MARATIVQTIKRSDETADPNVVSAIYTGLAMWNNELGQPIQEDIEFNVMFNLNATADQIEVAIRNAAKKRSEEVSGQTWQNNDIYQPNIRRG
jgi:hypothetical protein